MALKILIPARGGSKRIPRKNLVDVNGKPLIQYVIETCRKITDDIYVSTEDSEIQEFVESMNVNVIERPERLAQDNSTTEDVVEHFLEEINTDLFCVVQPTSPLLKFENILTGIELIDDESLGFDSVISVCRETNYYWDTKGNPKNFELGNRKRTQEHDAWYRENGAFYLTTKDNFFKDKILQNGKVGFAEMDIIESLDIDDVNDLKIVRRLIND